jgi:hypothetical protein
MKDAAHLLHGLGMKLEVMDIVAFMNRQSSRYRIQWTDIPEMARVDFEKQCKAFGARFQEDFSDYEQLTDQTLDLLINGRPSQSNTQHAP